MKLRTLTLLAGVLAALAVHAQSTIKIRSVGDMLETSWTDEAGILQQADAPGGPWENVLEAISPHTFAPAAQVKFFRVVHGGGGDVVGSLYTLGNLGSTPTQIRLPGLAVYLVNLATFAQSGRATTDVTGTFILSGQPPGHYKFCWEGPGLVSGCSTQTVAVVGDVVYPDPEPVALAGGTTTHALLGQVGFLDPAPLHHQDSFFGIDVQTTMRLETGTGELISSALPNSAGQFVLTQVPNQGTGRLVASVENLTAQTDVSFAQTDPVTLVLPNHRPQITRVFATQNGQEVRRAAPGSTVTLTAEATDPDSDVLHFYWVPSLSQGSFVSADSSNVDWTLPTAPGLHLLYVRVSDSRGGYATAKVQVSTAPEQLFSGQVSDADGVPATNATVTLGTTTLQTDSSGSFALTVTNDGPFVLTITKDPYPPISRVFSEPSIGRTYTFFKPQVFTAQSAAQDISVTDTKGTTLFIPANSLTRAGGLPIVNPVKIGITTVDPCDPQFEAPVSTLTASSGGPNGFLSSLSTAQVQIRDSAGNALSLNPNSTATLALPLSTGCASNYPTLPATLGVWSYDLTSGTWSPTGDAVRQLGPLGPVFVIGGNVAAILPFYNAVDPSGPYCTLRLSVDRTLSLPIDVRIVGPTFAYTRTLINAQTDIIVPPSVSVSVSVINPKEAPGAFFSNPTNLLTAATADNAKTLIIKALVTSPVAYGLLVVPLTLGSQLPYLAANVEVSQPFLTHNYGVGTAATAASYYAAIDPTNLKTTLAAWKTANGYGAGDEASAVYFNAADLGFGRSMHMRRKVGSDSNTDTAFYVSNFQNAEEARMGIAVIATVAMDYALDPAHASLGRYTKFYVFDAAGNRVDRANLDGAGDKYVPNLCITCHGGSHGVTGTAATGWNLNAKFIPFDQESYTYSTAPAYKPAAQHNAFRTMSLAIRDNTAPTTAITALINGWYGASGTGTFDQNFVPPAWAGALDLPVYRDVVKISCRACHTTRSLDFTTPASVSSCSYNVCRPS